MNLDQDSKSYIQNKHKLFKGKEKKEKVGSQSAPNHTTFIQATLHQFYRIKKILKNLNIPSHIMTKDIKLPAAPNKIIGTKFWKKCFLFTWNLVKETTQSGARTECTLGN